MRRNNTLSWRWDYLSTWPVHCSRILFSLLIARIQHLAQDDPIYLHNLLFSLLLPLNSVWRGWKQKEIPPKICETYCSWTCREKKWEKKKRKRQRSLLPKNLLVMIIFIGDCEVFFMSIGNVSAVLSDTVCVQARTFWGRTYKSKNELLRSPVNIKACYTLCSHGLSSSIK